MSLVFERVSVNCSEEKLWKVLLDKIENPQKYVPGVLEVKVSSIENKLSFERTMKLKSGLILKELIVAEPTTKTVVFKLVDHPTYRGFVTNMIFCEKNVVYLDYTLNWQRMDGKQEESQVLQEAITEAVNHTKNIAES